MSKPIQSPAPARVIAPAPKAAQPKITTTKITPPKPTNRPIKKLLVNVGAIPFWAGMILSALWLVVVVAIVAHSGPAHMFGGLPLVDWAIGISAIVSPVGLIWMVSAYLQRAADISSVAEPLRRQLSMITGESGMAEARIRRFNMAIREQIELLKSTQGMTQGDLTAIMDRVRMQRDELERFEHASILQVKEVQEIVRRNMQQVEQLMDDKFTMLRVLDGKLVQNGDAVARQVESVRDQTVNLLEEIETHCQRVGETLSKATQDSKKLVDISIAQEATLISSTENVAETLGGLSSKIDLSVARFLERTGMAREEAERLAGALDAQTRSLDDFSSTLPSRVSEAESVIRGVADRLYASEQLAREQATNLSDKLSTQVDGLQSFMDRFATRMTDIDGGLEKRRDELNAIAGTIGVSSDVFIKAWEKSIDDLHGRTDTTLERFTSLNMETRQNADAVITNLDATTAKYESAAERVNKLSEDSSEQMHKMSQEIAAQLAQFEALSEATKRASLEVENRASAAMQNLQHVLERLMTARDTTQGIGESLVKDLHYAVNQNEHLIERLNEAAQMSVYALSVASEALNKQEDDIGDRAHASEKLLQTAALELQQQSQSAEQGLRQQAEELKKLLQETEARMSASEQKLHALATTAITPVNEAVSKIDASTTQGAQLLEQYGTGLGNQLAQLQKFHGTVGGMGENLSQLTSETIETIEQLHTRFIAVRSAQQETARQTLDQFADFSDRLHREVAGLEGQTAQAAATLQQAAVHVGEQSYQMMQTAENSGAKIKLVTSDLQTESSQIRSILQKQAEELRTDIDRAEKQFVSFGEALQMRTESVHKLLDQVAVHYNDAVRSSSETIESHADRYSQVTSEAESKSKEFAATLTQNIAALTDGTLYLEAQTAQIGQVSSKAMQQLSALNEKINITGETANNNARQITARLEETGTAFLRQNNALSEAAQTSSSLIQKAAMTFGEQTGKLLDTSNQIDQHIRQLAASASTYAEQSTQIRSSLEQQNQRLVAELAQSITQLESTGRKLEQTTATATLGADQAATRFDEVTQSATTKLAASQQSMQSVASSAESMLSGFGANVTQQAVSLSLLSEQLAEQYKMMTTANESQRTQLVELFDKLGTAHSEASDVAERTIARLTDSLSQIQRHLGSLSDQSQTTVGNVREASTGFADQAAILIQNAQGAEQQARNVLSITSTLQEQARQLREAMQGESDRAGEMLGALLGKLSAGSNDLRGLSATAESSLTSLNGSITEQAQSLTTSMQSIGDRQRGLTTALDAQREVLNGLLSRLVMAQDETASLAERTASRLTDGTQQIARQAEVIQTNAQRALEGVQATGTAFADESTRLIQHANNAEQQAKTVLSVTSALQDQARQLRETVQGESDRAGEMLGTLLSKLAISSTEIHDVGAATESSLTSLNGTLTEQAQTLSATMQNIGERQRGLTTTFDAQQQSLNGLLGQLTTAQDETAATAERAASRLTEGTQQIAHQAEVIHTNAQRALESVQATGAAFVGESKQLIQHASNAELQAKTVLSVTSALQDQARQLRESIQGESDHAGEMLGGLLSKLAVGSMEIHDISATAETSLTSLHGTITEQAQSLTTSMHGIGDRQRGLTTALDAQREVLNGLLSRLVMAQDETASLAERTASRLTDGTQQIARQAEVIQTHAQRALEGVQATGSAFADESTRFIQHANNAEQQAKTVLSVTAALQDQAMQLSEGMRADSEKASDLLSTLISRITSGGRDLRDMSSNTELSLNSLHNGVTQNSQELLAMMQQIADRQRSLTTAMDAQRDVLNGLLTRFNVAQDDTAAVTERSAARITESATQVGRQAEIIEAQSQNAMLGVQAAGVGFADQVGILGAQAQQAEQHVRSVLSVTVGLQDQARQLRESMQGETTRAVEQLNATIAQLDATNSQLKQQSNTAISSMDQTALQFATLAHTSAEAMHKQSEILSETAEQAQERLLSAGEKMRSNLKLVSEVGEQAEAQARQLADVAEYATGRLVTLRETIVDSDRDGQTVLAQTSARIAEVKATLYTELEQLAEMSQRAVEQVTLASQGIMTQNDSLRVNLAMSESALSQAADTVREESARVPTMLDRSTVKIDQATKTLKEQTEEADTILIKTADRFISVTMTARECMVDEMRRVSTTAEQADNILRQFSSSLAEQMNLIQQNTAQLSNEQKDLVTKAEDSVAQLSAASDRLTQLRNDATTTAERLTKELDTLDDRASATSEKLTETSDTFIKSVDALAQVTQRAEGQMLGASSQFREQLERIRTGLQSQIDDINRGLMQITAQLERTGNTLRSTTTGTTADIERIAQRFDQTSKAASTQLSEKTAHMRGATEEVAKLLSGFGEQLDVLLDRLALAGDGIRSQEGGMIEQLQNALTHMGSIAERLETGRTLALNVSDQTSTRLGEVVAMLQGEMQNLTTGSQAAAGVIRGIGQIYTEQTQNLNKGVRDAHGQVMEMNRSVEDMQQRTDRLRVALKVQGQELMDSLTQILNQLSATGDTLGNTVDDVLRNQAEESLKKIS